MSLKKKFIIRDGDIRMRTIDYLLSLPLDNQQAWKVMITEFATNKSRDQEEKYHAMIGDIKKSGKFEFMGRTDWSETDIKRLLLDAFAAILAGEGRPLRYSQRMVPSLDGLRIVSLDVRSRDFTVAEAGEFIAYLDAYGSELGVEWSEPVEQL